MWSLYVPGQRIPIYLDLKKFEYNMEILETALGVNQGKSSNF